MRGNCKTRDKPRALQLDPRQNLAHGELESRQAGRQACRKYRRIAVRLEAFAVDDPSGKQGMMNRKFSKGIPQLGLVFSP